MGLTADFPLWVGAGLPLEVIVRGHVIVQAGLPLEIRGHIKAGAGPLCWSGFNSRHSFGDQRTYIVRGEVLLEWVRQQVFLWKSDAGTFLESVCVCVCVCVCVV